MEFALTDDQLSLRESARDFLGHSLPLERVAGIADSDAAWDPASWPVLAELGWLGVTVPEAEGGAGLGFVEQAILLEELGHALYCGPYLSAVLALPSLGPDDRAAVAAGTTRWSAEIRGLVPDLDRVDWVVTEAGAASAAGEIVDSIDPTRPLGRLADSARTPLPCGIDHARAHAGVAAEALGIARRALELGVEYAKERNQFGRAIGVYQAIAHPLANTFAEIELARSLTYAAAWTIDADPERAPLAAASAKAFATETAVAACERSIQIHGGIGFTWEHPLHRFYKRAYSLKAFDGYPAEQRAAIVRAALAGDDPAASNS
jgi:alkylation response protein AidB-like acyl-CoA dehydrogenase